MAISTEIIASLAAGGVKPVHVKLASNKSVTFGQPGTYYMMTTEMGSYDHTVRVNGQKENLNEAYLGPVTVSMESKYIVTKSTMFYPVEIAYST